MATQTLPATRFETTKRITYWFVVLGFLALLIGSALGPLQALDVAGMDVYPYLKPFVQSYYQGLTLHGVFNAFIFTTYFISGFLWYVPARDLNRSGSAALGWTSLAMMTVGTIMTGFAILTNRATVLYTFYPPLKADFAFYAGLALVVVASWLIGWDVWLMRRAWKRAYPTKATPLPTFLSLTTWIMWFFASLGIVAEIVAYLIPWSLGWFDAVDPEVPRTLFWFTGHAIVYFWVMPAFVSWYTMMPKQCGGKLVSDSLARLAFILLMVLSIPVGIHHQYTDAAIDYGSKVLVMFMTFSVAYPSLITAFTVGASLETGGRARGGRGPLGWFFKLPWSDPSVAGQLLAMITFIFGGAGGIVLASFAANYVVHNTMFIPGHFHITVGTATTMTFMAISFWLVPHLTGRRLWSRRLAQWSVWAWFVGMSLLSIGLHWVGILGAPRRTPLAQTMAVFPHPEWHAPLGLVAAGGVILGVAGILYFYLLGMTLFASPKLPAEETPSIPFAEALNEADDRASVRLFDKLGLWTAVALVLILAAYGPVFVHLYQMYTPEVGFRAW